MVAWAVPAAMVASAALSGAATVGGGMMANSAREEAAQSANQWGLWMQREAQSYNALMAETAYLRNLENWYRSTGFAENMSNTAYQRAMNDMRAAGMNPILAYRQGGASTPQVAPAAAPTAASPGFTPGSKADVQDYIGPAASSALSAASAIQGFQQMAAQIDQTQANTSLQRTQEAREQATIANLNAQTVTEGHRAGLVSNQAATSALEAPLRVAQTAQAQAQAGLAAEQTNLTRDQGATERERTLETIHRTHRTASEAQSAALEADRFRRWGPRTQGADYGANAEAIMRRIDEEMRRGLNLFRQ